MYREKVEITLIRCEGAIVDGFERKVVTESSTIIADERSVNRSEFYSAAQAGRKADKIFEIWAFEYDEQQYIEYEGKEYEVVRTYADSPDRIQLTCQRKDGLWK
ncbi:MAG: phage head closure protein [Clostridia bacterium]|nr:phage head closure protein [Clostridia bacterium]